MAIKAHHVRNMFKPFINIAVTCKLKRSQMLPVKCSARGGQTQVDAAASVGDIELCNALLKWTLCSLNVASMHDHQVPNLPCSPIAVMSGESRLRLCHYVEYNNAPPRANLSL